MPSGTSKETKMDWNGTHHLLVYTGDGNLFSGNIHSIEKSAEAVLGCSKAGGLEVNVKNPCEARLNAHVLSPYHRTSSVYEVS
jgi:hypothetical protein